MNLIVDRTIQMKDYCNIYIKLHFIQCERTLRVSSTKLVSDMLVWKYVSTSSFSFTSSTIMSLPLRISLSLSFSLLQIQNRGFFFNHTTKTVFHLGMRKDCRLFSTNSFFVQCCSLGLYRFVPEFHRVFGRSSCYDCFYVKLAWPLKLQEKLSIILL